MAAIVGQVEDFVLGPDASWEQYAERLSFYFEANAIQEATKKRAVLLSVCGKQTYSLIRSLAMPKSPSDLTYDEIVDKVKEHYTPRPSEIVQRFRFNKRNQLPSETVADFVANMRTLSEHCNFGTSLDSMLRDRLVCGIKEESVQRRLLSEPELTFKKALDIAVAAETANNNALVLKTTTMPSADVHNIGKKVPTHFQPSWKQQQKKHSGVVTQQPKPCFRCGGWHPPIECRHAEAVCRYCNKIGHLERVCLSKARQTSGQAAKGKQTKEKKKTMNQIENEEPKSDLVFSDSVDEYQFLNNIFNDGPEDDFTISLKLNGVHHKMEIDSGAACTILSENTFRTLWPKNPPRLLDDPVALRTWSHERLEVLGTFTASIQFRDVDCKLPVFVVKGKGSSLLGRNWFRPLGIKVLGIPPTADTNLVVDTFKSVFSEELGNYTGPPVSIEVDPKVRPIFLKSRPVPYALRNKVADELDRLVAQGVLEPVSHSEWATPIVPVLKKDGTLRICGDYRSTVNTAIKIDKYPLPTTTDLLSTLSGCKRFSRLDLSEAYLQLPVDEDTSKLLTLNTMKGLFRVKRLPFGVSSSPSIFQRVMDTLLAGTTGVGAYLDDLLVGGESDAELNIRQAEALRRIEQAGLRLKKTKCDFNMDCVEFLGFRIDSDGVHPTSDKVQAIHNAPTPKNKEELQSFLGLLNFYSCFLPRKATILEPLHRLLDKGVVWRWSSRHAKAFSDAKHLLQSSAVLAHYDATRPLAITCDASPHGVGTVLSQTDTCGVERPVAFASRTLNATERNYAQIDKEALAIIFGVKKYHQYLYGRKFTIFTDHKPLLGLFHPTRSIPQVMSPRMLRWSLLLSAYSYSLEYKPGKDIANADALSRLPMPVPPSHIPPPGDILLLEGEVNKPLDAKKVADLTRQDPVLSRVLRWVLHGWPEEKPSEEFLPYFHRRVELSTHRNCLLLGSRVVIPSCARNEVLHMLHTDHPGIVQMKALGRSYVWWPGLDRQVESFVGDCNTCQMTRNNPARAPVQSWEVPENPWSRLHVDFAGPFMKQNFFVLVDAHSKWLEVIPVTSVTSSIVIKTLRSLFATHGLPDTIVSDNASVFTSTEYLDFLKKNGIRAVTVAPYHPASNGQAERYVQTTKQALRKLVEGDWPCRLSRFLLSQHTTPHASTGVSPAELLMGRRLKIALDRLHPDTIRDTQQRKQDMESSFRQPRSFAVGDSVYARNYAAGCKWVPATITKVSGPLSYVVETGSKQVWRRHVNQLRRRSGSPHGPAISTFPPTVSTPPVHDPDDMDAVDTMPEEGPLPARTSALPNDPSFTDPSVPITRRSTRLRSAPRNLQDFYVNL